MSRWLIILIMIGSTICSSGCLIVHSHKSVVRDKEPRKRVEFDTPVARNVFHQRALSRELREESGSSFFLGIPFLLALNLDKSLSENAFYNDQVSVCDSNHDSRITEAEALAYNEQFDPEEGMTFGQTLESDIQQAKSEVPGAIRLE